MSKDDGDTDPRAPAYDGISDREKELEALLRSIAPAVRDVLWCALVWNDHNFTHADLLKHAQSAAQSLGVSKFGVEPMNRWLERIDAALNNRSNT